MPNGGKLRRRRSLDRNPLRGPPPHPHVRFYEWLALDPRMFMPPWYPPVVICFEPTDKIPYRKLQYPTYMKDIDLDVHIIL